jgi:hypothetical protein
MTANDPYANLSSIIPRSGPIYGGGPFGPLLPYSELVGNIVTQKQVESYSSKVSSKDTTSTESATIRGGIRVPHLHYNGEIYLLNKEQWNEFTSEIIKDFKRKLDEAQNVSFSQFMELSDLMNDFV